MISDCCHSGGMLDHQEIVISGTSDDVSGSTSLLKHRGVKINDLKEEMKEMQACTAKKNRAIDIPTLREMLHDSTRAMPSGATEKVR